MHYYDLGIFEPSGQLFHFGGLRDENILRVKHLQNGKGTNLANPPLPPMLAWGSWPICESKFFRNSIVSRAG